MEVIRWTRKRALSPSDRNLGRFGSPGEVIAIPLAVLYILTNHRRMPMITAKTVEKYGYVSLTIMIILLVLVWLKLVPHSLIIPLFLVAFLLFLGRIVLRIIVARQAKSKDVNDFPG